MKLYEINAALEALLEQVDEETGELTCDMEQLEALSLERDEKLEGLALYCKNAAAEAEAIKAEEKTLAERRKRLENRAERARTFLSEQLCGEKFTTPKVAVSSSLMRFRRYWSSMGMRKKKRLRSMIGLNLAR